MSIRGPVTTRKRTDLDRNEYHSLRIASGNESYVPSLAVKLFDTFSSLQVIGKFSIRLVPNMTPDKVEKQVCEYLTEKHKERGSPNPLK